MWKKLALVAAFILAAPTVGVGTIVAILAAIGATLTIAGTIYGAWLAVKDAKFHFLRV